jgi:hypothetical protein
MVGTDPLEVDRRVVCRWTLGSGTFIAPRRLSCAGPVRMRERAVHSRWGSGRSDGLGGLYVDLGGADLDFLVDVLLDLSELASSRGGLLAEARPSRMWTRFAASAWEPALISTVEKIRTGTVNLGSCGSRRTDSLRGQSSTVGGDRWGR